MRKFGGCSGKFGGRRQSENVADGEESTATGVGSTSVDSSSVCTGATSAAVPVLNSLPMPPIDEDHCTQQAFYFNLYKESDRPPEGIFEDDIVEV